jgi:hypothetical protein
MENNINLGFIIESDRNLEKRTGSKEVKFKKGNSVKCDKSLIIDTELYKQVKRFNSSIKNEDWSISKNDQGCFYRKNIKLFQIGKIVYPVPYDFDRTRKMINRSFLIFQSPNLLDWL